MIKKWFDLHSRSTVMKEGCNASGCSEFSSCQSVVESLGIDFPVLDRMMTAMRRSHDFHYVKQEAAFDFDLHGVNLRSCYRELLQIKGACPIKDASGVDGTR